MRFSHLTLAMPYQPGAISRSGNPFGCRQGRSVHLVAEHVVGAHRVGERHAAGEVLLHLDVADTVLSAMSPASVPQNTTSMPLSMHACLFKDGGERRAGPAGVANAADEKRKAVIAGAFERENNLLARPSLDIGERQTHRLLDQPIDFKLPCASRR